MVSNLEISQGGRAEEDEGERAREERRQAEVEGQGTGKKST